MTDAEIVDAMRIYGGSFVKRLSELWRFADADNMRRIKATWPEYWDQYAEIAQKIRDREHIGRSIC